MNSTCRCGCIVAAGMAAGSLLAVSPAAAADRHLSLQFEAYIGGISALTVGVQAGLRPDAYTVDFRFGTRGVVSWVVDWTMNAYSRGALGQGRLAPASAASDSLWDGDKWTTRLDYGKDGSVSAVLDPAPETHDPVPAALRRGTVDISSALLGTLEAIGKTGHCARRVKVYDGRRRYDLVFEDGGKATLGPDTDSAYHGPATVCRLWIDPKAGFAKIRSHMDWATGDYAKIYVAKPFKDGPPVPVALEYGTVLGQLRAYLTDARFSDGLVYRRLARNSAASAGGSETAEEDIATAPRNPP